MNGAIVALLGAGLAVGCRVSPPPEADAEAAARACLTDALAALAMPASAEDHSALTCADPFGDAACRAAWRAAAETPGEAAVEAAIAACREPMCTRVGDARSTLCADPSIGGGFIGQLAWSETWRAALEPELGHTRTMTLLGFWQGLTQPRGTTPAFSTSP